MLNFLNLLMAVYFKLVILLRIRYNVFKIQIFYLSIMLKIDILFLIAVVEVGKLSDFTLEELSEFWSALTICRDNEEFFAKFSAKEKESVNKALQQIEDELRHRHKEPVNFFQLMENNPTKVGLYLKEFSLENLLDLEADLKEFDKSAIVADFLKLVRKQIYQRIPVS